MNLKEAYIMMLEGNKVRRKTGDFYLYYEKTMKPEYAFYHTNEKGVNTPLGVIPLEDALAEDWEVVEEKKKYWVPNHGETYHGINGGFIWSTTNLNSISDKANLSIGNCFKTKKEAEHMLEKLKVIHELQQFAYENNEEELNWFDYSQGKYHLAYNYIEKKICPEGRCYSHCDAFNIYFTSVKLARKAIETIGENRIKKYYFDVKE